MTKKEVEPKVAITKVTAVKIGELNVKFSGALPLTIGDWKALKIKNVTMEALRSADDVEVVSELVLHTLKKVNPELTMDDVDGLTRRELDKVAGAIISNDAEVDRGFLTYSTS